MKTIINFLLNHCIIFQGKTIHSPKHDLQKLCKQGRLLGSDKISEHKEHVSRSLISSTATLSDTIFAMIFDSTYYFTVNYIIIQQYLKTKARTILPQINQSVAAFRSFVRNCDVPRIIRLGTVRTQSHWLTSIHNWSIAKTLKVALRVVIFSKFMIRIMREYNYKNLSIKS